MKCAICQIKIVLAILFFMVSPNAFAKGPRKVIYTNYNYGFSVKFNKVRPLLKNLPPSPDDGIHLTLSDCLDGSISIYGSTNAESLSCETDLIKKDIESNESQAKSLQFISLCKTEVDGKNSIRAIYLIFGKDGKKCVSDRVYLFRSESKKYAGNLIKISLVVDAGSYARVLSEFEAMLGSLHVKE